MRLHPYYIKFKSVTLALKIGGLMLSTHEKVLVTPLMATLVATS